ncbi:hypothetical protein DSO57_1037013 [Entomophthora muscae]|uniref:Uncharacterized protein n=1 Tax=Entomophthora muscae TaxID=34485 RepID=A0ACC2S185_9FUNG|nr:hypothetical protein DSO57_1037013 [Entomophthora muscae]
MIKEGYTPSSEDDSYDASKIVHFRQTLTRYHPQKKISKKKNLIKGNEEPISEQDPRTRNQRYGLECLGKPSPIISYWHNNFTINLVNHEAPIETHGLPPPVYCLVSSWPKHPNNSVDIRPVLEDVMNDPKFMPVYPILFLNDFGSLRSNLNPINETTIQLV